MKNKWEARPKTYMGNHNGFRVFKDGVKVVDHVNALRADEAVEKAKAMQATQTEQKATPRPWIAYPKPGDSNGGAPDIVVPTTYGGEHIAAFKRVEDRDFAVKAVNAYDADQEIIRELVEAAKSLLPLSTSCATKMHDAEIRVLTAIAKAEARK
ncbi:MAG: hypothetical protein E6Q97_37335 [Desulfurellales bacterium]|nr:MAG: hypothetical protein E6Q97_37335 [Desulfurellales bacterium]